MAANREYVEQLSEVIKSSASSPRWWLKNLKIAANLGEKPLLPLADYIEGECALLESESFTQTCVNDTPLLSNTEEQLVETSSDPIEDSPIVERETLKINKPKKVKKVTQDEASKRFKYLDSEAKHPRSLLACLKNQEQELNLIPFISIEKYLEEVEKNKTVGHKCPTDNIVMSETQEQPIETSTPALADYIEGECALLESESVCHNGQTGNQDPKETLEQPVEPSTPTIEDSPIVGRETLKINKPKKVKKVTQEMAA